MPAALIGLDLAKPVFQDHGAGINGKVVAAKWLRQSGCGKVVAAKWLRRDGEHGKAWEMIRPRG
jgi:hypothetical protein